MSEVRSLAAGGRFTAKRRLLSQLGLTRPLLNRIAAKFSVGSLTVQTPSGECLTFEAASPPPGRQPAATIILHRWRTLRRLLLDGDIGFAEAYLDGDWSSPDVPALIELAALNDKGLGSVIDGSPPLRLLNRVRHALRANSRSGSRRNIPRHYDLGNEFYAQWLDAGMSYSSAIYDTRGNALDETIEAAQATKQDRAIELLGLKGGERVLEIGCGWGGLAERIVRDGDVGLIGITLSPSQLAFARQRLAQAGLDRRADLRLQDYREIGGKFDRIISIEMLEAVGQSYWPTYFSTIRDRLVPGGVAVLQSITIDEHRFQNYRSNVDFIQRYIFPGGMLPSVAEMRRQIERAGLRLVSLETFGQSYAHTLAEWNRRFQAAWPSIETMGFSSRFKRMWEYYLAYCEGGFTAGAIDVGLFKIERPA